MMKARNEENILNLINGPTLAEREIANQVSLLLLKRLARKYSEDTRAALYLYMKNQLKDRDHYE